MKNIIYLFVVLFWSQLCIAQADGPYKKNYDNGQLKTSGQYLNGKRNGVWKDYYENGQLSKVYSFTNGKRNVEYKSYFKSGEQKTEAIKINGVLHAKGYYKSGQLFFERLVNDGYYKEFYEGGTLKIESNYQEGELTGLWTNFFETGEKEWEVNYFEGYKKGYYKQYYKNGQLKVEGNHSKNKKQSVEKRYNRSGILEWKGNYLDGLLNKKWKKFDIKGKNIKTLIYKSGVPISFINDSDGIIPTSVPEGLIEQVPIYPGCEDMLGNNANKKCMAEKINKFIQKKFNTNLAGNLKLTGMQKIYVIFKVDKVGNIVGVRSRAPHPKLEKEAVRVINLLPKMEPGKQRGKAVIVPYSLPIVFSVQ